MGKEVSDIIGSLNFLRAILFSSILLSFTVYGALITAYIKFKRNVDDTRKNVDEKITSSFEKMIEHNGKELSRMASHIMDINEKRENNQERITKLEGRTEAIERICDERHG